MVNPNLQILLVEDDPIDAEVVRRALGRAATFQSTVARAETLAAALDMLRSGHDVALLDLSLPDASGLDTLHGLMDASRATPIIVTTGVADEAVALAAVRAGAQDYLIKDQLTPALLERSIRYAIERQRLLDELRALSFHDELTGLYNRRGFFTLAEQARRTALRHHRGMLLFYFDLDGLKAINDGLGHRQGDLAILETATLLRETFRDSDVIARLGGDEFVVLAPETMEPAAMVERLLGCLGRHNRRSNRRYQLALSVGTCRFDPVQPCTVEDMVARADRAMYADKQVHRTGEGIPLQ